jgi:hypothetical protein
MLCEARLPRVVQIFYLPNTTYGGLRGLFRRNGGFRSVTTMCCLLFMPSMKRYLFVYDFHFDSVILTLLLLFLGCAKRGGGDQGHACRDYLWR